VNKKAVSEEYEYMCYVLLVMQLSSTLHAIRSQENVKLVPLWQPEMLEMERQNLRQIGRMWSGWARG
jgi:hypothetical protein